MISAAAGRNPDDIKLLCLAYATSGETDADADADARERHTRQISTPLQRSCEGGIDLIGSAGPVADRMGAPMAEIGGDGCLIRRVVADICRRPAPALQRRGLVRTEYRGAILRDTSPAV